MAYEISQEHDVLRINFAGAVTAQELAEYAGSLRQLETGRTIIPDRITDLSKATDVEVSFPDVMAFVDQRKRIKFANAFKSAIVVQEPVQMGMARMFATLNDHPQIAIRIFEDLATARAWIAGS